MASQHSESAAPPLRMWHFLLPKTGCPFCLMVNISAAIIVFPLFRVGSVRLSGRAAATWRKTSHLKNGHVGPVSCNERLSERWHAFCGRLSEIWLHRLSEWHKDLTQQCDPSPFLWAKTVICLTALPTTPWDGLNLPPNLSPTFPAY